MLTTIGLITYNYTWQKFSSHCKLTKNILLFKSFILRSLISKKEI